MAVPIIEQTLNQEMLEIMELLPSSDQQKLKKSTDRLIKMLALRLRAEDSASLEAGAHFLSVWLKTVPNLTPPARYFLSHAILRRLGQRLHLL